jgi:hypothetical protein
MADEMEDCEHWLTAVKAALESVNMPMADWQGMWFPHFLLLVQDALAPIQARPSTTLERVSTALGLVG